MFFRYCYVNLKVGFRLNINSYNTSTDCTPFYFLFIFIGVYACTWFYNLQSVDQPCLEM